MFYNKNRLINKVLVRTGGQKNASMIAQTHILFAKSSFLVCNDYGGLDN